MFCQLTFCVESTLRHITQPLRDSDQTFSTMYLYREHVILNHNLKIEVKFTSTLDLMT